MKKNHFDPLIVRVLAVRAAASGDIEDIKKIFLIKEIQEYTYEKKLELINKLLLTASEENQLDVVKYLFSNNELGINPKIHDKDENALSAACGGGHLDIVRYFLTSNELKETANIEANNTNKPLMSASMKGQLEIVKYLTTSKELEKHADINFNNGETLLYAWDADQVEVVQYMIFVLKIKKTKEINDLIKKDIELKNLFDKAQLKDNLVNFLDNKIKNEKINKL